MSADYDDVVLVSELRVTISKSCQRQQGSRTRVRNKKVLRDVRYDVESGAIFNHAGDLKFALKRESRTDSSSIRQRDTAGRGIFACATESPSQGSLDIVVNDSTCSAGGFGESRFLGEWTCST